jgi:O-antigen/teichoic acid export membrane protein
MLTRRIALVLRVGAIIFGVSALALLVEPAFFLKFLGLFTQNDQVPAELNWAMRMIGLVLIIVAAMMPVVAAFASERALRQIAVVMILVSSALSLLTVSAPGKWTIGRGLYVVVGGVFAIGYIYGLQGRRRNH